MSTLTITTIQTDIEWENKSANLQRLEEKIKFIQEKTEIVILPEMFSTGFSMNAQLLAETMEGNTVQWMKKMAADHKIILTGSLIIEDNGQYYNRLIWMLPNGQLGFYDKRHLFGLAGENENFSPGNKRLIASVKRWKINLQVCYDLRFPVWARNRVVDPNQRTTDNAVSAGNKSDDLQQLVPEYDVLIYVANWPAKRSNAWKTLLAARAIENQCYVVGVNRVGKDGMNNTYSGNTVVIDPLGEVLYHLADQEGVSTITLQREKLEEIRTQLPFWKDGDSFYLQ